MFKIKAVQIQCGEGLVPDPQKSFLSLCPDVAEGAREFSEVSFKRAPIPFMWVPPS